MTKDWDNPWPVAMPRNLSIAVPCAWSRSGDTWTCGICGAGYVHGVSTKVACPNLPPLPLKPRWAGRQPGDGYLAIEFEDTVENRLVISQIMAHARIGEPLSAARVTFAPQPDVASPAPDPVRHGTEA